MKNLNQQSVRTLVTIHTNTFSSEFGDEMTAYMTGAFNCMDEQDAVDELVKDFDRHAPIEIKKSFPYKIEEVEGEYGSQYYESIVTPGWFNHGMGEIYEDTLENEDIALKGYHEVMSEYLKQHHKGEELKHKLAELKMLKKVIKYPTEQGICIAFSEQLTKEECDFLKERAYTYAKKNKISILSFNIEEISLQLEKTCKKII